MLDTFFGNLAYGYSDNGVPYCFLVTWMDQGIDKPSNYSADMIESIFYDGELGDDGIYTPGEDDDTDVENTPNILFLQLGVLHGSDTGGGPGIFQRSYT